MSTLRDAASLPRFARREPSDAHLVPITGDFSSIASLNDPTCDGIDEIIGIGTADYDARMRLDIVIAGECCGACCEAGTPSNDVFSSPIFLAIGQACPVARTARTARMNDLSIIPERQIVVMRIKQGDVIETSDERSHLIDTSRDSHILAFNCDARAASRSAAVRSCAERLPEARRHDRYINLVCRTAPPDESNTVPEISHAAPHRD